MLHQTSAPTCDSHATESPAAPEAAGHPLIELPRSRAERKLAIINLLVVVVPIIGFIVAVSLLWGVAFSWLYLLLLAGMGLISSLGITVGFHRLCTHKSFKTPAVMRYLFAAAGSMAVQGPVIFWCAEHRRHHQHSDTEEDPHSPHMAPDGSWGDGLWATLRGAFHSHCGWLFSYRTADLSKYRKDLESDPALVLANRQFVMWVIIGLVVPAILGGLFTMSWIGVLLGFLWGGLVRILLVHHITWSVNSVCHLWGTKPFESHDESRNNLLVGILALGEGWHNNHHAFPTSARHGLRWWEFDLSYLVIRAMQFVRLARDVRLPDRERIASKLRERRERVKNPMLVKPKLPA